MIEKMNGSELKNLEQEEGVLDISMVRSNHLNIAISLTLFSVQCMYLFNGQVKAHGSV